MSANDTYKERTRFSYLALTYGAVSEREESPLRTGEALANQAIEKLRAIENPEQFPPALLMLLLSKPYLDAAMANQLVAGVHKQFLTQYGREVPLLGTTVAGVLFDKKIHEDGALLLCFASRVFRANVAVGMDARNNPDEATHVMLSDLHLDINAPHAERDINPVGNRWLFTFFPGCGEGEAADDYAAPRVHVALRKSLMGRISIVGGVSFSEPGQNRAGLQIAGRNVYRDAMVTALIDTGVPYGIGMAHGLKPTGDVIRAKSISSDRRRILEVYDYSSPAVAYALYAADKKPALIRELTPGEEALVMLPEPQETDGSLRLRYPAGEHAVFEVLKPDPTEVANAAATSASDACGRYHLDNPMAYLLLGCAKRHELRDLLELEIEAAINKVISELGDILCLGGLFAGEAYIDSLGRSALSNWSVTGIILGDELRERTVLHQGFAAARICLPELLNASSSEKVVNDALDLVWENGYPGAMLSFLYRDQPHDWIVAQDTRGARFKKIKERTRRALPDNDILAIVAREKKEQFIEDSTNDPRCNPEAITASGLISQYIVPLLDQKARTFAVLQIDMGDMRRHGPPHTIERGMLDFIGKETAAALLCFMDREELRIVRELDEALSKPLAADTVEKAISTFLASAFKIFGTNMGHVRLTDRTRRILRLVAGSGKYYEAAMKEGRKEIDFGDSSPTCSVFHSGTMAVVNWADKSGDSIQMRKRFDEQPALRVGLECLQSYANIPLKNEWDAVIGTLNIASEESWFFTEWRLRALEAFALRLGFLIEFVQRRTRQEEFRRQNQFFMDVAPRMKNTANIDNPKEILADITKRIKKAARADLASLYIRDKVSGMIILRAQAGWDDAGWIDRAHYNGSGWTWATAKEQDPRYTEDLKQHKKDTGRNLSTYAREMFGNRLGNGKKVEAIAIPLWVAGRNLGIMTLHRVRTPGEPTYRSGFTTTDPELLHNAADGISALVNTVITHQEMLAENKEKTRREKVMGTLVEQQPNGEPVEKALCRVLFESYGTESVKLFLYDKDPSEGPPRLAYWKRKEGESAGKEPSMGDYSFDENVIDSASSRKNVLIFENAAEDAARGQVPEDHIRRISIPLILDDRDRVTGVLDMDWGKKGRRGLPWLCCQDTEEFQLLGKIIALGLRRHYLYVERECARKQAESGNRAAQAMGAMVFQMGHRVGNLLQNLMHTPALIRDAEDDQKRNEVLDEASKTIEEGIKTINRPKNIVSKIRISQPSPCCLLQIINDILDENKEMLESKQIVRVIAVSPDIQVVCYPDQIKESLSNVIRNAATAMGLGGTLWIEAVAVADQRVKICIKDSGRGMTTKDIEAALDGFVTTGTGMGVGVLIARMLIVLNGGTFDMSSIPGVGTEVVIHLPESIQGENNGR